MAEGVRVDRWRDVRTFLVREASDDLAQGGDVRPCFVAFRGEQPLFVAFLRSFAKGAYADPIIELLALAAPLDADRVALSLPGRAWSMDDPIPPVLDGVGDLRQRVLCTLEVDGAATGVAVVSTVHPFSVGAGGTVWGLAVSSDSPDGWIISALTLAVGCRDVLAASERDIRRQARRCAALGHVVAFAGEVARELGLGEQPPIR